MSLGAVIQARMGSTRLPGKVLKPIGGRPLLGHILSRLGALKNIASIVVATTELPQDDTIAAFCSERRCGLFRGSEENVLGRFVACAERFGFSRVIRLTGDNPFTDIEELDRLIDLHRDSEAAFAHSLDALPVGVGAEIFTRDALEQSLREADQPHHFEHLDEVALEHPERYRTVTLEVPTLKRRPDIRLTIDTEEDYLRACALVRGAENRDLATEDFISRLC